MKLMSIEEFIFSDKKILIEKRDDIGASYKINAYWTKLKYMEENKIPQKEIKEVLNHFFNKNSHISNKTKKSISKIIYSLSAHWGMGFLVGWLVSSSILTTLSRDSLHKERINESSTQRTLLWLVLSLSVASHVLEDFTVSKF